MYSVGKCSTAPANNTSPMAPPEAQRRNLKNRTCFPVVALHVDAEHGNPLPLHVVVVEIDVRDCDAPGWEVSRGAGGGDGLQGGVVLQHHRGFLHLKWREVKEVKVRNFEPDVWARCLNPSGFLFRRLHVILSSLSISVLIFWNIAPRVELFIFLLPLINFPGHTSGKYLSTALYCQHRASLRRWCSWKIY